MQLDKKLQEREKELEAFHRVSEILYTYDGNIKEVIQKILLVITGAFQYPEITAAFFSYDNISVQTENYKSTGRALKAEFTAQKKTGCIEVAYLRKMPDADEGPFLKEEKKLLGSLVKLIGMYFEMNAKNIILDVNVKEKELLLKEIHHRVKNNLQIINSLMRLQSNMLTEENTKDVFKTTENRIKAISLIEEKLFRSANIKSIDYGECFTQLTEQILGAYKAHKKKITFTLDFMDFDISINRAIPLALIINELITNSIKHAFKDLPGGNISISFKCESGNCRIEYIDNGCGLNKDFDAGNPRRLGYMLINALTSQLDGGFSIENKTNGFKFTLNFPVN